MKRDEDCDQRKFLQSFFVNYPIEAKTKKIKCVDGIKLTINGKKLKINA
jgi:hypothetical protein